MTRPPLDGPPTLTGSVARPYGAVRRVTPVTRQACPAERSEVIRVAEDITASKHEAYVRIHNSDEFKELRRRFRGFVLPATIGFMSWYMLYVLMSSFAADFMSTKVVGNINVALVFGLLQFVTTFLLAYVYSRFANKRLDPTADKLRAEYDREVAR